MRGQRPPNAEDPLCDMDMYVCMKYVFYQHIYVYIYICVCMCVCNPEPRRFEQKLTIGRVG